MRSSRVIQLGTLLVLACSQLACPPSNPVTCSTVNCSNGCCTTGGVCVTSNTSSACGLNASACAVCTNDQVCNGSGLCVASPVDAGANDAGSTADASTPADAGKVDAGAVDAGTPCDTAGDPVLGTFALANGATVTASGALPSGVIQVAESGGVLYGLTSGFSVRALGSLPSLTLGTEVGSIVPSGFDAGVAYISGYLAVTGTKLMGGFTQAGANFPGKVTVFELTDGGHRSLDAPGNFTAAGVNDAFVVNGGGIGASLENAAFGIRTGGADLAGAKLVTFDPSFDFAGSGPTAVTGTGVLLVGYAKNPDFASFVRAVPSSAYAAALAAGTSFTLAASAPVVASGFEVADVVGLGDAAIVVRGGYGNAGPYTTKVDRIPLSLSGGGDVVVGAPVTLLQEGGNQCTRVIFTATSATSVYLGLQDKQGRRLVKLTP